MGYMQCILLILPGQKTFHWLHMVGSEQPSKVVVQLKVCCIAGSLGHCSCKTKRLHKTYVRIWPKRTYPINMYLLGKRIGNITLWRPIINNNYKQLLCRTKNLRFHNISDYFLTS